MKMSRKGVLSCSRAPQQGNRLLVGCVWALLVIGLAWGEPAAADGLDMDVLTTWAPEGGDFRFGLLPFSTLQKDGEWNLGAARDLGFRTGEGAWSYLGAGLSLVRPLGGALDPETEEALDGVELGAWVGGCVSCTLGGGVTLDLEMRWAPDSLSLGGDPLAGEQRSGLMLRIPW